MIKKVARRLKRKMRTRVFGCPERPRLSFYKSNKHMFAQIIDDQKSVTLVSVGDTELTKKASSKKAQGTEKTRGDLYFEVGELIAAKSLKKNITKVVLDRSGFRFHGLVKKFAEGARKGGLIF